jgi:hypothetical protein
MGLMPIQPIIPEAYIVRNAPRPLLGDIRPGMIFAWEPDSPTARELVIVTRVEPDKVWARNLEESRGGYLGYVNDEDRFREACWPTLFKDQTP